MIPSFLWTNFRMDPRSILTNDGMTTRGYLSEEGQGVGMEGRCSPGRPAESGLASGWLLMDSRKRAKSKRVFGVMTESTGGSSSV